MKEQYSEHRKKMIAPIVITILMVLIVGVEVLVWLCLDLPWYAELIGCLLGAAVVATLLGVLVSRIKEIRSGEEDDLSQY